MSRIKPLRVLIDGVAVVAASLAIYPSADAQQVTHTQQGATQQAATQQQATQATNPFSSLTQEEHMVAQLWSLSDEEMLRAKLLMEGPRKAFSIANISPVEVLGIHARSDAERAKYAEKFARTLHEDTERILAFQDAFNRANASLYPGAKVVDYSGVAPIPAPIGAADALGVPRTAVIDQAPSAQYSAPATPVRSTGARR